jgi:large repetitive protein
MRIVSLLLFLSSLGWGQLGTLRARMELGSTDLYITCLSLVGPTLAGVPYTDTCSGNRGTSLYTFSVSSGSLPTGITLDTSTGVISGTTYVVGSYSYTIRVTDSEGYTSDQPFLGSTSGGNFLRGLTLTGLTWH